MSGERSQAVRSRCPTAYRRQQSRRNHPFPVRYPINVAAAVFPRRRSSRGRRSLRFSSFQPTHPSVYQNILFTFIYLSIYLPIYLPIYLSKTLFRSLSFYVSIFLSVYQKSYSDLCIYLAVRDGERALCVPAARPRV